MKTTYFLFAGFLILTNLIPLVNHPHWFFRGFDFGKVQFFALQLIVFILACIFMDFTTEVWVMQGLLLVAIISNSIVIYKYSPLYKVKLAEATEKHSESIILLSANVYQFNKEFERFVDLIRRESPDIFLTMESNQDWDDAMSVLEKDYPHHCKVPLENTYGMHLYTRLPMKECKVHYFVADDIPSIEMDLETRDGYKFTFFAVHPPPPSPTEEETSKERDGELLSVSKKIREDKKTTIVVGDFNNVAWAKSSVLFRKTSEMVDPRIGRGLISTFHAKYWWMRFPIDHIFHSPAIFVEELRVLDNFGSDHLPLYCKFFLNMQDNSQEEMVEELEEGDMQEVNEMIQDGKAEMSDRPAIAVEGKGFFSIAS